MKNGKLKLLQDTVILGGSSILLNALGIVFQAYLSGRLGADGVGLFQLICSVYVFATTFATSGISLSVTRIITEAQIKPQSKGSVHSILSRCMIVCLVMGLSACALQFVLAPFIAGSILGYQNTSNCFRILAFGLPFMSASSCMNGFFIAERKASKSAASYIFEDLVKMALIISIFNLYPPKSDAEGCVILTLGVVISEMCSCTLNYIMYLADKRRAAARQKAEPGVVRNMLRIAAPVATSSYLKSGLTTLENLLVPIGLQKYGFTVSQSLSVFGTFKGLIIPVLLFPSSIIGAFTRVLMPEIADSYTVGDTKKIDRRGTRILGLTLIFSVFIMGIFIVFADELCMILYSTSENAWLLRTLAPLVPVMYIDGVVDGILKGMDEQFAVMRYNVYEAIARVFIVYFILPHTGTTGFIITIYAGNTINTLLSLAHLIKISKIRPDARKTLIFPSLCICFSALALSVVLKKMTQNSWLIWILGCLGSAVLYAVILHAYGSLPSSPFGKKKKLAAAQAEAEQRLDSA